VLLRFAHWIGGIALHWFYADIVILDRDRIPRDGPLLVAMNHQNALVDALLAMWAVPRDVRITAKATIGANPLGALLVRSLGIVSLRRSADEGATVDRSRNEQAFASIEDALRHGEAVLMFPEGRSHSEPGIAPLKTGLARAAFRARASGVRGIRIVPIGAAFEDKAQPGTDAALVVGELIDVDAWSGEDPHALTTELAARLAIAAERGAELLALDRTVGTPARHGNVVSRLVAAWGDVTHRIPLRIARRWALAQSDDPDQPAMYTMIFGLALVLLFYLLVGAGLWVIAGPIAAIVAIVLLIIGADAAAHATASPNR
jgi:1-acyl-sn-glycerol-3-phosphate acyltransferase